jgi:signal transduction histidine kinase/DNA-binding response OmpR family regulator/sugar lactone lactonase YvrE
MTDLKKSLKHIQMFPKNQSGVLWIGTNSGGLNKFNKQKNNFTHFIHDPNNPNSISNNAVYCILEDNKRNLWISTDGGGLNKFDVRTKKFTHYRHNPNDSKSIGSDKISVMLLDSKGELWISLSPNGLSRLNPATNKFNHYRHIESDPQSISPAIIYSLYEDMDSIIWLGTAGDGLYKFEREKKSFKSFKTDPKNHSTISNNFVSCILEDAQGTMWVGTQGGGLNKFNRSDETFIHYQESDGLPNNVIYGILEDNNGNLWMSTNKGIAKFNPNTETFTTYDHEDGLQGDEFNHWAYFKSRDGTMRFGGSNGFSVFRPDSFPHNYVIPKITFTDFQLQHKPVPVGYDKKTDRVILNSSISETERIELNHDDNVISFEFAALDFHSPANNEYAYKMENFDKDWTFTTAERRFVSYTNLDPGEYIFRVKASNNDDVWNETGASLKITVAPPWWETWFAYTIFGILLVFLILGVRTYDLKRQRLNHELELEHKHAEKLEEIDHIKSHFFANISHEFRTPLTLILGPIDKIMGKTTDEFIIKQSKLIKRNANRLFNLINQLLDLSKLDAGKLELQASCNNLVLFVKGVITSFEEIAERKDITLKVKSENEHIETYFDREKMEGILTNIISNALKFTPEGGSIIVTINQADKNLVEIKVRDTGIGISNEELPKLFDRFYQVDSSHTKESEGTGIGLALTKELVELHQGWISVSSKLGEWTEVLIRLPLGKAHLEDHQIIKEVKPIHKKTTDFENGFITMPEKQIERTDDHHLDRTVLLVVEDNADVREYIKESIGDEYDVEEAINGEQGVRKAEKLIPDLIISDIMMPKMDGNELTRVLKQAENTSHIPIILLTAKSEQESKLESLETGADDYLTKPFDVKELRIRIKNLIDMRRKLQEKFSNGEYLPKCEEKTLSGIEERFMCKVVEVIEGHLSEEEFSIEEFSNEAGMSRSQIHRKLKALTGKSPSQYIRLVRISKAKEMILEQEQNISEIAYSVGFSSPAYFTRCFKEEFGYPPSDLLKHN